MSNKAYAGIKRLKLPRRHALALGNPRPGNAPSNRELVTMLREKGEFVPEGNPGKALIAWYEAKLASGTLPTPKPKVKKAKRVALPLVATDAFLMSFEWRKLRMEVLKKFGPRCMCCGATPADGAKICVDHIKPRRKYPELALVFDNLQILCHDCNHGKGSWDETDWRPSSPVAHSVKTE